MKLLMQCSVCALGIVFNWNNPTVLRIAYMKQINEIKYTYW